MRKFCAGLAAGMLFGLAFWWARPAPAQDPAAGMPDGRYVVFEIAYNPASASTKTPSGQMKIDDSHCVKELETLEAKGWTPVQVQMTDTVIRVLARGNP